MKLEDLINIKEQVFVIMGGIPGAGKTTIAKQFEEADFKLVSVDAIRAEISASRSSINKTQVELELDQSVNGDAWNLASQHVKSFLQQKFRVILDATNPTRKQRARTLSMTTIPQFKVPTYAVYVDTTLETTLQRNFQRAAAGGRNVPDFVIRNKWRTQTLPLKEEGFNDVVIVSEITPSKYNINDPMFRELINDPLPTMITWHKQGILDEIFPSFARTWGIEQNNKNHLLQLHMHMLKTAELFKEKSPALFYAALLHDVGKVDTKQYFGKITMDYGVFAKNEKVEVIEVNGAGIVVAKLGYMEKHWELIPFNTVEVDNNAHFYDHHYVGAIYARRDLLALGASEDLANDVYTYILYHMALPFNWEYSLKSLKRLLDKITPEYIPGLIAIRYADKHAGVWTPDIAAQLTRLTDDLTYLQQESLKISR